MTGIQFVTDEKGRRVGVLIDLKKHGLIWEDFWDGLKRPLDANDRITISVDIADFEDNENQLSLLAEHLIQPEPMVARLTYVWQALPGLQHGHVDRCVRSNERLARGHDLLRGGHVRLDHPGGSGQHPGTSRAGRGGTGTRPAVSARRSRRQ